MAIPVYWASLSWVPKGILTSIEKLCSEFLWAGSKSERVTPWIAWGKIARPKEWGGWGIKNLACFSQSLAVKLAWRIITMENLWTVVIKRKYIDPLTTLDWIRMPHKSSKNSSVVWKAVVVSVNIIEKGLAWLVGDGTQVRLGQDPWIGCPEGFTLSQGLVTDLKDRGLFTLNQVVDPGASSIWNQGWLQGRDLNLVDDRLEEWGRYIRDLLNSSVRLSDSPDELKWVFAQNGVYSPKAGYKWMMSQKGLENPDWWAKSLWKLKGPAKSKLFFWCVLLQKVPTWDFLQRRGRIGPGRCPLCKGSVETAQHLFLLCPFNSSLWAEMLSMIKVPYRWEGQALSEAWQRWWNDSSNDRERTIPLLITWGTWLARNQAIFMDSVFPIGRLAAEGAAIYESIPFPQAPSHSRAVCQEFISYTLPWAYFDGASGNNGRCGAGLIIHFSKEKAVKASIGLG